MSRFALPAFALVLAAPALAEARYFSVIDDVPMPPGFTEVAASADDFSGPGGRILLSEAEGAGSDGAVRDFYEAALPQLGWAVSPQPNGALVFQRGREQLSFTLDSADGRTLLGVRLVVLPAPSNGD